MINLRQADTQDVQRYARSLFNEYRDQVTSFEQASMLGLEDIYHTFREDDTSTFALARIFRLCSAQELAPDIRTGLGDALDQGQDWLALMATIGDDPAWCDRRQSQQHQAVLIDENMSLMFQTAIHELGFDRADIKGSTVVETDNSETVLVKYFYVADAVANPAVPDKRTFVEPYGIKSVIGLGSKFASESFYIGLFFSKIALSDEDAEVFSQLSVFLSTLLAVGDGSDHIWMS